MQNNFLLSESSLAQIKLRSKLRRRYANYSPEDLREMAWAGREKVRRRRKKVRTQALPEVQLAGEELQRGEAGRLLEDAREMERA